MERYEVTNLIAVPVNAENQAAIWKAFEDLGWGLYRIDGNVDGPTCLFLTWPYDTPRKFPPDMRYEDLSI